MNLRRVGHLLTFELKRIKWLIAAAWVGAFLAFVPRILGGMGLWSAGWYDAGKILGGIGLPLFGLAGLLLVVWAGSTDRGWRVGRPVKGIEMKILVGGVLWGALILPIVFLTCLSLFLYDFEGELILRTVGMVTLATALLWSGWCHLVRYAESVRVLIGGLGALVFTVVLAEFFEIRNLSAPWINLVGGCTTKMGVLATAVTSLLLWLAWPWVRNRAPGLRMGVGVLAVILGWVAMKVGEENYWRFIYEEELSDEVIWIQDLKIGRRQDGQQVVLAVHASERKNGDLVGWELLGELTSDEGAVLKSRLPAWLSSKPGSGGDWGDEVARHVLEEGTRLAPAMSSGMELLERGKHGHLGLRIYTRKESEGALGRKFSGRLGGVVTRVKKVMEVPFGKEREIDLSDVKGKVSWFVPRDAFERTSEHQIRATGVFSEIESRDGMAVVGGDQSPWDEWVFILHDPKSKVAVVGETNNYSDDLAMGGLRRFEHRVEFRRSRQMEIQPEKFEFKQERLVLLVYRTRVVEKGFREVVSPPLGGQPGRARRGAYATVGPSNDVRYRSSFSQLSKWRPDPVSGTAQEAGAWFRMSRHPRGLREMGHDFAALGEKFGGLMIEIARTNPIGRSGPIAEGFLAGADDQWRDELIAGLGEVSWAADVILKRGWEDEAREEVTRLLKKGDANEEVLKLGLYLEISGAEEKVLGKLAKDGSRELYRVGMGIPGIRRGMDAAMDKRGRLAEQEGRALQWAVVLRHGRDSDLKRFLKWWKKKRSREVGVFAFPLEIGALFEFENGEGNLEKPEKLRAGQFVWDEVKEKWVFGKEGKFE